MGGVLSLAQKIHVGRQKKPVGGASIASKKKENDGKCQGRDHEAPPGAVPPLRLRDPDHLADALVPRGKWRQSHRGRLDNFLRGEGRRRRIVVVVVVFSAADRGLYALHEPHLSPRHHIRRYGPDQGQGQ